MVISTASDIYARHRSGLLNPWLHRNDQHRRATVSTDLADPAALKIEAGQQRIDGAVP